MTDINDQEITIEGQKDQFLAGWYALKTVIKEEIPATPGETAFLMQVMTRISPQVKDTNKVHKVTLSLRDWIAIWHCINICLNNDGLSEGDGRKTMLCQMMSYIAPHTQTAMLSEVSPDELV